MMEIVSILTIIVSLGLFMYLINSLVKGLK